jgi:hypothetical protein
VRGSAKRHTETSNAQRENLSTVDPGHTCVGKAKSNGKDVYESDGCTAHEHFSLAESVDYVVHGNDDAGESDDTVDSSSVETGRLVSNTDRLEDTRRVVVGGIGPSELNCMNTKIMIPTTMRMRLLGPLSSFS